MSIPKKIGYKKVLQIEHKKIDEIINGIINATEQKKNENEQALKTDFKKWVMPIEPKGYIRVRKNDPL